MRTSAAEYGQAERVKTLPISGQAWADTRSVMSLPAARVGELVEGDRLEAAGEFEVTVCLKPNALHPGNGQPCIGRVYDYSPYVKARLVIAPTEGATAPEQTKTISRTITLQCRQNPPVRNHHCVVSVPWSSFKVTDPEALPCASGACTVNMLATAYHPDARSDDLVVVGSSDDNKKIHQGLAQISAVRHRPGDDKPLDSWRGGRVTKQLKISDVNDHITRTVVYSAKVSRLDTGDQLVIDALPKIEIGGYPYNVFTRTEVVLAKSRHSVKPFGKLTETTARASASNGFNCTQGSSAHARVCGEHKTGVLSIKKNAKGPFYVNVVMGQAAIGTAPQTDRWRPGDTSRVSQGGYVKVERYEGAGSCNTCSTGWVGFSENSRPTAGRAATLVDQLRPFGLTSGAYNCGGRSNGDYVCLWRARGRFGRSPEFECDTRAFWNNNTERFAITACKDALAAQLWNELTLLRLAVHPSFAGACEERKSGDYRCKWFGDLAVGPLEGQGCKGFAVYKLPEHDWAIDPCKPKGGGPINDRAGAATS